MTRPRIEPRSPGPLANTLTARPMSGIYIDIENWNHRNLFLCIYPAPLCHKQDMIQGQFLSEEQLVWIKSFLSPRLVAILSLPCYFTQSWGVRVRDGLILFPRVSEIFEMQRTSFRIWTRTTKPITYHSNCLYQIINPGFIRITFSGKIEIKQQQWYST